ncbi:MAG TPA: hypothetical protein VFZ45_04335, partial [Actinomycetota bacterium]|nr:hypothetical protein [Actinomycetota bacterium]
MRIGHVRSGARWRMLAAVAVFGVLLAQFVVWAGPGAAQVSSPVLYGYEAACDDDNLRQLYTINPATG